MTRGVPLTGISVGFGWTCRLMALIVFICSTLSFTLLKTRLPPKPPGPFFYMEAFKSLQYNLALVSFVVRCPLFLQVVFDCRALLFLRPFASPSSPT